MNFEDTARVIASYLDNQSLERVFISGAMPSLISLASDQNFWHARVETFSRMRFSFSREVDWRDTYCILVRTSREFSSFSSDARHSLVLMFNETDNVLACKILLSLGYQPTKKSLALATQNGCTKILQFLLEEGSIDPGEIIPELYVSPLTAAVQGGHVEAVRLLLADSRVDPQNGDASALQEACLSTGERSSIYCEIVKLLLEDGRLNPGDGFYIETACDYADNFEIVRLLLADDRIVLGDDIIHAARMGRDKTVELLLQDGRVDPGIQNNEGLLRASAEGHIRVVRLLLADKRVDPGDGRALDEAITHGHSKIVELLLQDERIPLKIREDARSRWWR